MSRRVRIEGQDALYHLTARAVAGADLYRDDRDRETFLATLGTGVARYRWICHSFCLMTNHYHLVIEMREPNLARGMQWLNGTYACRFNRRHGRPGHLLQARYDARLIEDEAYLLEVTRYVVLNPVRAGLCNDPADWRWSSYRATAGLELPPPFLSIQPTLSQFGDDLPAAQAAYRAFVAEGAPGDSLDGILVSRPAAPRRPQPLMRSG